MFVKTKIFLVLICDSTMPRMWWDKIPNIKKHDFILPPPIKKTFDFFGIHLVVFKIQ